MPGPRAATAESPARARSGQAFAAWYQQSTEPEVALRPISEFYLMQQLVRAYLRAPWLMPDDGSTRTERAPPRNGWPFPVRKPARSAGDAPLRLSVTSTAVQAARDREEARQAPAEAASDAASAAIYQSAHADEDDVAGTQEELDAIPADGGGGGGAGGGGGRSGRQGADATARQGVVGGRQALVRRDGHGLVAGPVHRLVRRR